MSGPRFSVIIPTCRRNDLLAKCLQALAPDVQTLGEPYEVIVTDDSGDEKARQLIEEKFPWAKWTPGPCRGPAANRNHGAALATGQWLAFTDDDCIPSADWLAAFAQALASGRQVYEGRTTTDLPLKGPRYQAPANEHGGYLWSCNIMLSRQLFNELGGFDAQFPYPHLEDVDLRLRIEQANQPWDFVPAAVILHPQRPATPWLRRARSQQSAVYMCQKFKKPLSFANLDLVSYLRRIKQVACGAGPLLDRAAAVAGLCAEYVYIKTRIPYWKNKYK
ncbi:glycosyltransferase family A protein [Ruficoccus sp. ZRK36]|uniref:glycosyltransferase family 2 protein n=1 Tax=Ruficoccus sp. ZRK36 TaxID=2866311 RepID=UPI001C72C8D3|nr:glycosyltransferase family A protein [Ruficoccus sp. ZRK36]QYY36323.1 glycosyltransferase family 2 protein [Ruficoccus sp. ZRK36]